MNKKVIRCAIYTRKSCEEGLEQDFNSLDAQREACEAYIKSQFHEGWILIDKQYNDGGFSGGTLERPAVRELFQDIKCGKIDIVVVYKVDRLTRSLMDFSKIVEIFNDHAASFVSITQQFNTTTSMGRLTLNMLLSFAQFEREVTGERIRDKVAASKKKGMWMGGRVPIGYKLENKKLIPDENGAKTVKTIFEKYQEVKSILKVKNYLDENNIHSRTNKNFSNGNLSKILTNKIYQEQITHKEKTYEGEHDGIISKELFLQVQETIAQNRKINKMAANIKSTSLLVGKIWDDKNNRMSPSHSNTRNKRYRYYVSQAVLQGYRQKAGSIYKVPAEGIENLVKNEISLLVKDKNVMQGHIAELDVYRQKEILHNLSKFEFKDDFVREILETVTLYSDKVEIVMNKDKLLENIADIESTVESEPIKIVKNIKMTTTSRGSVLIVNNGKNQTPQINPFLVKIIAKSYYWNKLLEEGKVKSSKDIQKLENLSDNSYIKNVLRLRFLSPRITEAILEGRQPADLTVQKLFKVKILDWTEQEKLINFSSNL